MIQGKKVLAWIPARGGSKGVKDKNIHKLCGMPLIAYTIEAAKKSKYVDDVIVSTDSERIAAVAGEYGAEIPFLRPQELASDTAKTVDAVCHSLSELAKLGRTYDIFCLLQPTQPLRDERDIDGALEQYISCGELPLASISEVKDHPILMRTIGEDGQMSKLLSGSSTIRRQEMPAFYRINGCIYLNPVREITNETSFNDNLVPYLMAREHSVDIDELSDFAMAEYYLRQREV